MSLALEKAQAIREDEMLGAYEDGMEDGRNECNLEIAKAVLAAGEPPEKVVEYTGLSLDDVKAM